MKYPSVVSPKTLAAALAIAGMSAYASLAFAWTAPTASPPNSNVSAPINVSGTGQTKSGSFVAFSLGATNGLVVSAGNAAINKASAAYALDVSGTVAATQYLYSSDSRLKTNIAPLQDALGKIEQLQGVSFTWKDTGAQSVGLIAQDVAKVYPQLVDKSSVTGYLSVAYGNLVAPLIEAVKSLAHHDNDQDAQIAALKAQVADLQAQVAALKNSR